MNFVKKLFHQQQRSSNQRRHHVAATADSVDVPNAVAASVTSPSTVSPSSSPGSPSAGELQKKKKKQQQEQRRRHKDQQLQHVRHRRIDDVIQNDVNNEIDEDDDDDDDVGCVVVVDDVEERNGNSVWKSPSLSPAKSPSRRRGGKAAGAVVSRQPPTDLGGVVDLSCDSRPATPGSRSSSRASTPTRGGCRGGGDAATPTKTSGFAAAAAAAAGHLRSATVGTAASAGGIVTREIRMTSSPHVAQVLPNLLLGSQEIANNLRGLRHYRVTHVLNVTVEVPDRFPDQFVYKRIAISDMPSAKLAPHFDDAFGFIDSARSAPGGGCCLVHCYYGHSRSASLVIAYLILVERMRYADALRYLQLLRPGVRPNDGFQKQLKNYEATVLPRTIQPTSSGAQQQHAASGY